MNFIWSIDKNSKTNDYVHMFQQFLLNKISFPKSSLDFHLLCRAHSLNYIQSKMKRSYNLPRSPMTIAKAGRTLGVNRAMGRLGYANGEWVPGRNGSQNNYDRGTIGLSPDKRKASPNKSKYTLPKYSKIVNLKRSDSPRKGAYNDQIKMISPNRFYLRVNQCIAIIKEIFMFFKGEHLEVFFIEEFFSQNAFQQIETISLGDFWVKMISVQVKMRRKGVDLDLININFNRRKKPALVSQEYGQQNQLNRNLGYESDYNSPIKPSTKRFGEQSTYRRQPETGTRQNLQNAGQRSPQDLPSNVSSHRFSRFNQLSMRSSNNQPSNDPQIGSKVSLKSDMTMQSRNNLNGRDGEKEEQSLPQPNTQMIDQLRNIQSQGLLQGLQFDSLADSIQSDMNQNRNLVKSNQLNRDQNSKNIRNNASLNPTESNTVQPTLTRVDPSLPKGDLRTLQQKRADIRNSLHQKLNQDDMASSGREKEVYTSGNSAFSFNPSNVHHTHSHNLLPASQEARKLETVPELRNTPNHTPQRDNTRTLQQLDHGRDPSDRSMVSHEEFLKELNISNPKSQKSQLSKSISKSIKGPIEESNLILEATKKKNRKLNRMAKERVPSPREVSQEAPIFNKSATIDLEDINSAEYQNDTSRAKIPSPYLDDVNYGLFDSLEKQKSSSRRQDSRQNMEKVEIEALLGKTSDRDANYNEINVTEASNPKKKKSTSDSQVNLRKDYTPKDDSQIPTSIVLDSSINVVDLEDAPEEKHNLIKTEVENPQFENISQTVGLSEVPNTVKEEEVEESQKTVKSRHEKQKQKQIKVDKKAFDEKVQVLKVDLDGRILPLLENVAEEYQPKLQDPSSQQFNLSVLKKVVGRKAGHILDSVVEKNWNYWKRLMQGKGKERFKKLRSQVKKYIRGELSPQDISQKVLTVSRQYLFLLNSDEFRIKDSKSWCTICSNIQSKREMRNI